MVSFLIKIFECCHATHTKKTLILEDMHFVFSILFSGFSLLFVYYDHQEESYLAIPQNANKYKTLLSSVVNIC